MRTDYKNKKGVYAFFMKKALIIADSQSLVRLGLRTFLEKYPSWTVAGEASSVEEARMVCATCTAGIVLLEAELEGENGLALIPFFVQKGLRVLVYALEDNASLASRAIELGASGFLAKTAESPIVIKALETVASGNTFIERNLQDEIKIYQSILTSLTKREREIFSLVEKGYSNACIARECHLSAGTVKQYMNRIYNKSGTNSRESLRHLSGAGTTD